nr:hypothetical protein [Tanacetum cinerariifolium]
MVQNVDSPSKFLIYPRLLQVIINAQVDDLSSHTNQYTSLALTQKVFANMYRVGKGFSGVETPLFATMLVQPQPPVVEEEADVERLRKVGTSQRVESYTEIVIGAELQGKKDDDNAAIKDASASEPIVFDDEELHDEEVKQAAAREKQEKEDLEKAKVLQKQYEDKQEKIDWNIVAEQMQKKHLDNIRKYQSLKRKPISIAQARKNMIVYLKNMAGYKMELFKGKNYDKVRPIFKKEYNKVQTLFKPDKDVEKPQRKRVAEETLLQESFKKLKVVEVLGSHSIQDTPTDDPKEMSEEDVKNMLEIASVSEFKVEALQVKYPLIDWEIHSEGSRTYWKIIRVGGITQAYQSFEDKLKDFDREDLDVLWRLVKDKFNDVIWKLQRYMHYPIMWKLHCNCEVHQVSSTTRRNDMYMLTEKDYPLSNGVMTLMLSTRLQVEEDSEMARDLVMKIFMKANQPKSRTGVDVVQRLEEKALRD